MDYSKTTVAKRTRLQHDLLYQKFNEEKKKKKRTQSGENVARVEGLGGSSDCCSVNPGKELSSINDVSRDRRSSGRNKNSNSKQILCEDENGDGIGEDPDEAERYGTDKIEKLGRRVTRGQSNSFVGIDDGSGDGDKSGRSAIAKVKQRICRNGSGVGVVGAPFKGERFGRNNSPNSRKPVTGIIDGSGEGNRSGRDTIAKLKQRFCGNENGVRVEDDSGEGKSSGRTSMGACLKGKNSPGKSLKKDENVGRIGVVDEDDDCETCYDDVVLLSDHGVGIEDDSGRGVSFGINDGSKKIKKTSNQGFKNRIHMGSTGACLKGKSPLGKCLKKDENVGRVGGVDEDDECVSGDDIHVGFLGESVTSNGSSLIIGSVLGSLSSSEFVSSRIVTGGSDGKKVSEGEEIVSDEARSQVGNLMESEEVRENQDSDLEDSESESSSEEDNDDPYDSNFIVDNSSSSSEDEDEDEDEESVEEKTDNEVEDDEECHVVEIKTLNGKNIMNSFEVGEEEVDGDGKSEMKKERSANEKEQESVIEGGLKRKRAYGLDILIDCEKDEAVEHRGPATRLRSRSFSKSREKKLKLGGISRPLPVEEYEELDSLSANDSDGDADGCDKNGVQKSDGKEKGMSGKSTVKKHTRPKKAFDVIKILTDSIWHEVDELLKTYDSPQEEPPVKAMLSYKFKFKDEDEIALPIKSEWEIEVDALFVEMDMASTLSEIGSFNAYVVDNDDSDIPENGADQATQCLRGKHQLILREPYGIMCKFCSYVDLEMKHILPSLIMNPFERRDKYYIGKADSSNFAELQFQDADCEYLYGSKDWNHEKGTVWDLVPGVGETMYPHQREGFEFIWKSIAGGLNIEKLEKPLPDGGSGCIISHAPGTGKSRLTIIFLQTFMKLYPESRPVIIAPRSMLLTWENEFHKWNFNIPFHNMNMPEFSGHENSAALNLLKSAGNVGRSTSVVRLCKLYSWKTESSILGISYSLFEQLAGSGGKRKKSKNNHVDEQIRRCLLQVPSLLVLDEGHTPRNKESLIYQALSKVKTQRRILLSGTPFQNNFEELYNIFCLVNPEFVESTSFKDCGDFGKRRGRKSSAAKEKWAVLTSSIGRHRNSRIRELRAMIDPFVHVHKGTILEKELPGLRDALVVLKPTEMQKTLLESIQGQRSFLKEEFLMSLISVHPSLLPENIAVKEEFSGLRSELKRVEKNPYAGVKTKFLIELIRISEQFKEKVLVFSKYIDPLNFIMELLEAHFNWIGGKEVLHMDGQMDEKHRQSAICSFNDPNSEVKVLLASIKACNEGINLVGASRVVLLDVNWNPSVEQQAISRAYRIGQEKVVYIYHLVTGTMEVEKYDRQVEKDRLSELVFSCKGRNSFKPEISLTVSEDNILKEMVHHEKLCDMFEEVIPAKGFIRDFLFAGSLAATSMYF